MKAAINTVQSLAKANDKVLLCVDNQVIFYYLQKGGEKESLQPTPTAILALANGQKRGTPSKMGSFRKVSCRPTKQVVSRQGGLLLGCKTVQLHSNVFQPFINLETDLFASPGNKKLSQFVARWPHWQARALDALNCNLESMGGLYANPPWSIIQKFLTRLKLFPQAKVLMVVPYWDSTPWWPQLIKMKAPHTPCLKITPYQGMFTNCWGEQMPPPRWHLFCLICSGKFWKGSTFQVTPSMISLEEINH